MLRNHFPSIQIANDIDNELTFFLPVKDINKYPQMLDELQKNLERLHISKYRIHISTIEELFLKADLETRKQQEIAKAEQEDDARQVKDNKGEKRPKKHKKSQKTRLMSPAHPELINAAGKQQTNNFLHFRGLYEENRIILHYLPLSFWSVVGCLQRNTCLKIFSMSEVLIRNWTNSVPCY